jgi:hypothetical protein
MTQEETQSFWERVKAEGAEKAWHILDSLFPSGVGQIMTKRSFTMFCTCTVHHDKTPEGKKGCGAYWALTATGR